MHDRRARHAHGVNGEERLKAPRSVVYAPFTLVQFFFFARRPCAHSPFAFIAPPPRSLWLLLPLCRLPSHPYSLRAPLEPG